MIKKYVKTSIYLSLAIFSFSFISCEKKFDNVIDTESSNYQVKSVIPKDSILFNYQDSSIIISIEFQQGSKIFDVNAEIFDPLGKNFLSRKLTLYDNGKSENGDLTAGDNIYSNKILMKRNDPNGKYSVKYFVNDNLFKNKLVALSTFKFINGELNLAPVISNALIDPDTLIVTSTTIIQTSVKASDPNGLNDIKEVYFVVYRPDGTTNNIKTQLFDDGNISLNGDITAGDGIFSRKIQVDQNNAKGTYRFEFKALDRGGLSSNIINYLVLIQ
ncbi:MAG: hypothetical protein N2043_10975 [Ignavibacterium sp.]|nr:hypothetical protein [Ignavibacterium sp.]